jgi:hypothetical protein
VDPQWNVFVAKTRTGQIVKMNLPFLGTPAWSYAIGEYGSWTLEIRVGGDGGIPAVELVPLLDSWRFSWGIAWGSHIFQCGPLVTAGFQDDARGTTVRVAGAGIWALLNKRFLVGDSWVPGLNIADALYDVDLPGLSLHTIGKRLVQLGTSRTGHNVPIVLPADITGADARNYPGYDVASVGERLQTLTKVDGGPEIEFRPQFADTTQTAVQWLYRSGNPRLGDLSYQHVWHYQKALTRIDVDFDGSRLVTTHITKGSGTERAFTYGIYSDTTLTSLDWPALEDADSDQVSDNNVGTVDSLAKAHVDTYGRQYPTYDVTVRLDGTDGQDRQSSPSIPLVAVGNNGVMHTEGHRLLGAASIPIRIIGISSGSDLLTAKLKLQEVA